MKKILFVLGILACSVFATAQEVKVRFIIKGNFVGVESPNGYAYLQGHINGRPMVDSVKIVDDRFEFVGEAEPTLVKMYTKRLNYPNKINPVQFFVDKGTVEVTAVYDTTNYTYFSDVKVKGSAVNDEFDYYTNNVKKIVTEDSINKLKESYMIAQSKNDTVVMNATNNTYQQIIKKVEELTVEHIKTNSNSFVSLYLINQYSRTVDEKNLAKYKDLLSAMNSDLQFSATGKRIAENMSQASKGHLLGKTVGDFEQTTSDGKVVRLSDYKGKFVLLDFWASWCGPCRAENPHILKVYNQYKEKGFAILAVSLDTDGARWKKAIEEDNLPWVQVSDLKVKNAIAQQFGVSAIPDNFLVDPNGIVVARGLRGEELNKKMAELIK